MIPTNGKKYDTQVLLSEVFQKSKATLRASATQKQGLLDEEVEEEVKEHFSLSVASSFCLHTRYSTLEKYTFKRSTSPMKEGAASE